MSRIYRLAVVNSHVIHNRAPLYRRLARESDIDLTVYYYSRRGVEGYFDEEFGKRMKWDVPLLDGYDYKFLPNLSRRDRGFGLLNFINPSIIGELRREKYDAVLLHGYMYTSDYLTMLGARLSGTPIFYRSEASLVYDREVSRPWHLRIIKPSMLRTLFRQVSAFLVIGTLNREFYRHHGADERRIFHAPYAIDNEFFMRRTAEYRASRAGLRRELGIGDDAIVFLFAAKMTAMKAPLELLRAYREIAALPNVALVMVGDGELKAEAERYAQAENLPSVHFTGFINQSELPKYYALSDVFIRPDGLYQGDWGLTVNEAMAAGLALISSDRIGATIDLVHNGANGRVIRFGDPADLSNAMREMASDAERTRRMGERSIEIIKGWSYEECVQAIKNALQKYARTTHLTKAKRTRKTTGTSEISREVK
ncbi:MAG: hypothetical protein NVSMB56_11280 [Pyrinomonadaceae bacterium]